MARRRPNRPASARPVTAAVHARIAAKRAELVSRLMSLHAILEAKRVARGPLPDAGPDRYPDHTAGP